jgi:hypothetical protein
VIGVVVVGTGGCQRVALQEPRSRRIGGPAAFMIKELVTSRNWTAQSSSRVNPSWRGREEETVLGSRKMRLQDCTD